MWSSSVVRTAPFLSATGYLAAGECDVALSQLTALRKQYENDAWSTVELDRWIAMALTRNGREEEAYVLLQQLRPGLEEFQFDLSNHYFQVIQLQQSLGELAELQSYCESITGHIRTQDALGHLDWMLLYASLSEAARLTDFMYTVLAISTIQLGLDVPPRGISGSDFRNLLERCIELRDGNGQTLSS